MGLQPPVSSLLKRCRFHSVSEVRGSQRFSDLPTIQFLCLEKSNHLALVSLPPLIIVSENQLLPVSSREQPCRLLTHHSRNSEVIGRLLSPPGKRQCILPSQYFYPPPLFPCLSQSGLKWFLLGNTEQGHHTPRISPVRGSSV